MNIDNLITELKGCLGTAFDSVDSWFDKDDDLIGYTPKNGGWTIAQILEHTGLANHFLLILIDKGAKKALANAPKFDLDLARRHYVFRWSDFSNIGLHKSFVWSNPTHMTPKGEKTLSEVRRQLKDQLKQCLDVLDKLKNGEGMFYKTTMTVDNLGKIDVYQYIYFLAQHAQRHITQMGKNEEEYNEQKMKNTTKPIRREISDNFRALELPSLYTP